MGAAIGNIGGVTGASGAKDLIAAAARATAADGSQVAGILQQLVGNLTSTLAQGAQPFAAGAAGGGAAKQALQSFQSDLTRLAYISALQKAMSKAGRPGPFNVETAINDLWVALDGVRKGHAATNQIVQAQMQQATALLETLTNITKQMHDVSASAIRNIR